MNENKIKIFDAEVLFFGMFKFFLSILMAQMSVFLLTIIGIPKILSTGLAFFVVGAYCGRKLWE